MMKRGAGPSVAFEAQPDLAGCVDNQERLVSKLDRTFGEDDPRVASALVRMGSLVRASGRLEAAQFVGRDAYEKLAKALGEDHPQTLAAATELGLTLLAAGRLEEAERLLRSVYDRCLHLSDPTASSSAATNLALALRGRGDLHGALLLQERAVADLHATYGADDPATVRAEMNQASLFAALGERETARRMLEMLRDRLVKKLGESHPAVLGLEANLGAAYREWGDIESARGSLERVYATMEPTLGRDHPSTLAVAADLAVTLGESGDAADGARAIELGEHVVGARTQRLGREHPQSVHAMRYLARAAAGHDDDLALRVGEEAAQLSEQTLGRAHPDTLHAVDELAATLERRGRTESADRMRTLNAEVIEVEPGIVSTGPPAVENLAGALASPDPFMEGDFTPVPIAPPSVGETELIARTAYAQIDPPREIRTGESFQLRVFLDSSVRE
ncbi:MAG: tetratricopeptide repeat protein, partial [Chloroflexi bacterium]|nr:tetratricopeptide repeat protein [Chloroflexota bacterium]